jgi:hypothetical protein
MLIDRTVCNLPPLEERNTTIRKDRPVDENFTEPKKMWSAMPITVFSMAIKTPSPLGERLLLNFHFIE